MTTEALTNQTQAARAHTAEFQAGRAIRVVLAFVTDKETDEALKHAEWLLAEVRHFAQSYADIADMPDVAYNERQELRAEATARLVWSITKP